MTYDKAYKAKNDANLSIGKLKCLFMYRKIKMHIYVCIYEPTGKSLCCHV